MLSRRDFLRTVPAAAVFAALSAQGQSKDDFKIRYTMSSALYGTMPLDVILPEVAKTGAESIDIWCKVHGDQREQATALGEEARRRPRRVRLRRPQESRRRRRQGRDRQVP